MSIEHDSNEQKTSSRNDAGNHHAPLSSFMIMKARKEKYVRSEPSYFVSSGKLNSDFIGIKILKKGETNITTLYLCTVDARF